MSSSEYRIVVVGAGGVGKSAITVMFIQGTFLTKYDPTIEDSYMKVVEVDQQSCTLDIMDTAGQEEFGALRDQYMKTGHGFLIVYSITTQTSFEAVSKFRNSILRVQEDKPDIPIVLVGNKKDLEEDREVGYEEGKQLASRFGSEFLEASAKTPINVSEAFYTLVKGINKWREKHPTQAPRVQPIKPGKRRCNLF
eukprot:TRINITY_DN11257_c0_g1_i1.p1 TRINITY_DN11257_c0_g1~~TRINITY_DN11257_c0_g1_i1.p1  ORF type:complete len:195 (-),score=47.53 TRINITY_DN11257_c0_g1_i1:114-698(-)